MKLTGERWTAWLREAINRRANAIASDEPNAIADAGGVLHWQNKSALAAPCDHRRRAPVVASVGASASA
jgi:hypothetical protein